MLPRHKIPCYSNSAAWRAPRKLSRAVHSRDETRKLELVPFACLLPCGDDGRREGVRDVLRRTRGHGYDSPGADAGAREAATQASARA